LQIEVARVGGVADGVVGVGIVVDVDGERFVDVVAVDKLARGEVELPRRRATLPKSTVSDPVVSTKLGSAARA
jgi:hypothetical protein